MADPFTATELEVVSRQKAKVRVLVEVVASAPPATSAFTWRFCTGYYQVHGGNKYTPRGLSVSGVGRGPASIARITIKLDNRDKALGEDIAAAVRTVGATCTVTLMTQDPGEVYGNPIVLLDGWLVRVSTHDDVSLEASVLYGQRREASLMKGSRNCGNAYVMDGSKLCQYSGVLDTCLRTKEDCIAHHGDLEFYNGFLSAPSSGATIPIGDQIVRVPSSRTNWYEPRSGWGDQDGALSDSTAGMRFIADGFLEDPVIETAEI